MRISSPVNCLYRNQIIVFAETWIVEYLGRRSPAKLTSSNPMRPLLRGQTPNRLAAAVLLSSLLAFSYQSRRPSYSAGMAQAAFIAPARVVPAAPTAAGSSSSSGGTIVANPFQKPRSRLTLSAARKEDEKAKEAAKSTASMEPPPRPDPSILIASKDATTQRLAIGAITVSLVVGTGLVVTFLEWLHHELLPPGWFELWRDYTWGVPMGLIFVAAGVSHFTLQETFVAMVPPPGTWGGLWQIPAPGARVLNLSYAEYHAGWSGVAEICGGAMLVIAAASGGTIVPVPIPALFLFALTAIVTPANIYMATHDIQPPGLPPVPYPSGHLVRGLLQCVLLAIFWELTFQ
jgi:uncharacterized membrane protein